MHEIVYRDATPSDIATIIHLMDQGAPDPSNLPQTDATDPRYLEAFMAIQQDPNHSLVVAEKNGEVIGTLQISYLPGLSRFGTWRGVLESVHIRPDQRGTGIGTDLVKWAIEQCRARDCWLVQLTSNKVRKDAHRFYAKLGFAQSHEGFKLEL